MQKIALVQNQVYMSYASKSDVRPLLTNVGFEADQVQLYTAHNIKRLKHDLDAGEMDAIIFSSNSLNEKSIRTEVDSESFREALADFLHQGKGLLILHQLNSASSPDSNDQQVGGPYDFLPLKPPRAVIRGKEPAINGNFIRSRLSESHPLFHFPNTVSVEELKQFCIRKKGLYWHYLDGVDTTEWDILLYDENESYSQRPLVITTKETSKHRVVISSLNLDWQREDLFFKNLLQFVLEGKCNTAIIKDANYNSMAFEFFLETLNSLNYRYQLYDIASGLEGFKKQIEQGVHSIVVLGPTSMDVGKEALLTDVESFLGGYIEDGKMKYIGIEPDEKELKQFFVAGREKFALRILQETELKIQRVFQQGKLIDDSFWSSVDTLKVIKGIADACTTFSLDTVQPIFDHVNQKSLQSDSYSGLLVPTSSLLWMRATYLGVDSEECQKTVRWMKHALLSGEEAEVESVLAYNTFLELAIETEFASQQLQQLICDKDLSDYNEIEIVHYIKAAILLKDIERIKRFIGTLATKRNQELLWIDLSISANIVTLLLEALVMLKEHDAYTEDIEGTIEDLVFPTVITMQNMTNKNVSVASESQYHWDNKANTTLKCISAILKFEELMDLPVTEMVQSLVSYSQTGNQLLDNKTALQIVEEFKDANSDLKNKVQDLDAINKVLLAEKTEVERKNQEFIEELTRLKTSNKEHEDEKLAYDRKVNGLKYAITLAAVFFILLVLNAIFYFNDKKAFEGLVKFYNLEWNVPALMIFIFTALLTLLTNFFMGKNKGKSNQQNL